MLTDDETWDLSDAVLEVKSSETAAGVLAVVAGALIAAEPMAGGAVEAAELVGGAPGSGVGVAADAHWKGTKSSWTARKYQSQKVCIVHSGRDRQMARDVKLSSSCP
jgi:hypothetical protein